MTEEITVETPVNDNAAVDTAPNESALLVKKSLLERFEEWFKAEETKTTVEIHDWFVANI